MAERVIFADGVRDALVRLLCALTPSFFTLGGWRASACQPSTAVSVVFFAPLQELASSWSKNQTFIQPASAARQQFHPTSSQNAKSFWGFGCASLVSLPFPPGSRSVHPCHVQLPLSLLPRSIPILTNTSFGLISLASFGFSSSLSFLFSAPNSAAARPPTMAPRPL